SYDPNSPGQEHQYSGINRAVYAKLDGPRIFITYGEVQFMLAEAAVRGWISGNAEEFCNGGVAAAMKILSQYDEAAAIYDEAMAAYLINKPFVGTATVQNALEQINTQYWAATSMNAYESFANVRRSGYPQLIPINYPHHETGA